MSGTTPQAESLRASLALLTAKAVADLRQLVKFDSAAAAREQLIRFLPDLVNVYGSAAASVSADWYEELRLEVAPKQRFTPVMPVMDAAKINAQTEALARWSVSPLVYRPAEVLPPTPEHPEGEKIPAKEPDPEAAASMASGGLKRAIMNEGRTVIRDAVIADPAALGWYRITDDDPCAFCALMASRVVPAPGSSKSKKYGTLYQTKGTAGADANKRFTGDGLFKFHNDCGCTVAPAFSQGIELSGVAKEAAEVYQNRGDGDAMKAFREAWVKRGHKA